MARIGLIHWRADQADRGLEALRKAGHEVQLVATSNVKDLRALEAEPPDALLIDLSHRPKTGRDVAIFFARRKGTRHVPLVMLEGAPPRVEAIKKLLPDAIYSRWAEVTEALDRALAAPPTDPAVPGAMAPFAGTPLRRRLGIEPGTTLALLGAPDRFEERLGDLPASVRIKRRAVGKADLALLFVPRRRFLDQRLPLVDKMLGESGGLWVAWPKRGSEISSDLSPAVVRSVLDEMGWVDYKVTAVDVTWSGLKFARRRF
jgi:hypothetical protein